MRKLVVLALCVPVLAYADTPKEHFQKAQEADAGQRWEEAIAEYQRAYELSPHPDVLFNIAVDYEHIEEWEKAADYFQRYLDERDSPAKDAADVKRRIRKLRAKVPKPEPPPQPVDTQPAPPPVEQHPPVGVVDQPPIGITEPPPAPPVTAEPVWHLGLSYGFAFGDVPSERYQLHGGRTFAGHIEADAIAGTFGHNDYAAGVMTRITFARGAFTPFLRGAATIGIAKQDSSSMAETKFPLGFEAGGGVQFGKRGRIELTAVGRFTTGGWDAASTTAPSYINDSFAFAIDLGFSFDVPIALPHSP